MFLGFDCFRRLILVENWLLHLLFTCTKEVKQHCNEDQVVESEKAPFIAGYTGLCFLFLKHPVSQTALDLQCCAVCQQQQLTNSSGITLLVTELNE